MSMNTTDKAEKIVTRRRALTLFATTSLLPLGARAASATGERAPTTVTWRGAVLGAAATMTFHDTSRARAQEAIGLCLAEVARLEEIFSLYRDTSQLVALNRHGNLGGAAHDLRRLLVLSRKLHQLTGGAFDPTIQPLWRFNADWFAAHPGGEAPSRNQLQDVQALIAFDRVRLQDDTITLGDGQAMTLNGIAQGYITDAVAALLRARGWRHVLLDLGEFHALGSRPDSKPFRIALANSTIAAPLNDQALAGSAGSGFVFPGANSAHTHLFDPRTGLSPRLWRAVHVRHASAAIADGLSTAFYAMGANDIARCVKKLRNVDVWAQAASGPVHHFSA